MLESGSSKATEETNRGIGALASRLSDASSQHVFVVRGIASSQLERELPALRKLLTEKHHLLITIDHATPASAQGHLFDAAVQYARICEQRGVFDDDARELLEFLAASPDDSIQSQVTEWGRLFCDGLGRLWSALSRQVPAVLLVLNARCASDTERAQLGHLLAYFFSDPIETLMPELESSARVRGCVVLAGIDDARGDVAPEGVVPGDGAAARGTRIVPDGVPVEEIDLGEQARKSVQDYLSRPDVIRRFIDSTGGDTARLSELVETLPSGVEQFWMYRYRQLDESAQTLVALLALAGQPLGATCLHSALERLGQADGFARCSKVLAGNGFIRRTVGAGEVLLGLEHAELAAGLAAELAPEVRRRLHEALARAELDARPQSPALLFVARHLLAAGCVAEGVEYGLPAVRGLLARRAFERAGAMLDAMLAGVRRNVGDAGALAAPQLREIHEHLVEVHAASGAPRRALAHCGQLKRFVDGEIDELRLWARTAQLLVQIGECTSALRLFERAESVGREAASSDVPAGLLLDIQLGRGDALYALGRHAEAIDAGRSALDGAEAARNAGALDAAAADSTAIRARNLLGKIAIFQAQYDRATRLFEQNDALAAGWGWEREMARAQANLGVVEMQQRRFDEAHARLTRALELARVPGSLPRAYCLLNLGNVHQRRAQFAAALDCFLEALRASRQSGDSVAYSVTAHNLVTLYQDMGAFARALAVLGHLEEREQGARHAFVGRWSCVLRGHVLLDQDRFAEAIDVLSNLSQADAGLRGIVYGAEALLRLAEAHIGLGQVAAARQIIETFEVPDVGSEEPQLLALRGLCEAEIAAAEGNWTQAQETARRTARELSELGLSRDTLRARLVLARALVHEQRAEEARQLLESELRALQARALEVPAALRAGYYAIGLHQRLVTELRPLAGDIPAEFVQATKGQGNSGVIEGDDTAVRAVDPAFARWRARYSEIIGEDSRLHQVFRVIDRVASSDTTVLITGESGTGKELVAEALHARGERARKPFVRVNCAAFVESLLLSELFGHEKGAFTGAMAARPGRFEMANGGTLFLDEIGDISPNTQVALLRVLQEGTFERVGGSETRKVDVRVVCATNRNLEEMVNRGEFRLDLYYRLKGIVIEMPALRDRRADIPLLLDHFAQKFSGDAPPKRFSREAIHFLSCYRWSGNIREMENFVRSILLFVEGPTVEIEHIREFGDFFGHDQVDLTLPELELELAPFEVEPAPTTGARVVGEATTDEALEAAAGAGFRGLNPALDPEEAIVEHIVAEGISLTKLKKRLEFECIKRALIETDGNITRAAEILQMKRPRLSQIINSTPELLQYKAELVG